MNMLTIGGAKQTKRNEQINDLFSENEIEINNLLEGCDVNAKVSSINRSLELHNINSFRSYNYINAYSLSDVYIAVANKIYFKYKEHDFLEITDVYSFIDKNIDNIIIVNSNGSSKYNIIIDSFLPFDFYKKTYNIIFKYFSGTIIFSEINGIGKKTYNLLFESSTADITMDKKYINAYLKTDNKLNLSTVNLNSTVNLDPLNILYKQNKINKN